MLTKLDQCLAKLDEINRLLSEVRTGTTSVIIHSWVAMFFLPAAVFIGAMLWLGH